MKLLQMLNFKLVSRESTFTVNLNNPSLKKSILVHKALKNINCSIK